MIENNMLELKKNRNKMILTVKILEVKKKRPQRVMEH